MIFTGITVCIKNGHPHEGEVCNPVGESAATITSLKKGDTVMWLVKSIETGIEFYAETKDMSLLNKTLTN